MIRILRSVVTGSEGGTSVPVALTATVSVKNGAPS
jgi:hypothetical protein